MLEEEARVSQRDDDVSGVLTKQDDEVACLADQPVQHGRTGDLSQAAILLAGAGGRRRLRQQPR